jgi:hypothetical protein
MQAAPSKSQSLTNEIHQHILKHGGRPSEWYVGVARHTDRLFVDHRVAKVGGWWIFRQCGDSETARAIEKAFIDWGCAGGCGGGDSYTTIVYAYLMTSTTRE